MKTHSTQTGLTLLEILVAITILSIMLGVIYTTFLSATKTASLLESDEDIYQTARALLGMMTEEIQALYEYEDPSNKWYGLTGTDSEAEGHSLDDIFFLTTAHRLKKDGSPESEIAEVGYFFDVDSTGDKKQMIKVQDATVDLDFKNGGRLYPLTDQIEEFNITYFDRASEEWASEWNTEQSPKKELPDMIKVELSILDEKENATHFRAVIQPGLMLRK